jgi:sec-independent protein translocase protein TatA
MTHNLLPFGMIGFGQEMIWILLAILVLFGGRKLPELARGMGSSITQFKKGLKDDDDPPGLTGEDKDKGGEA